MGVTHRNGPVILRRAGKGGLRRKRERKGKGENKPWESDLPNWEKSSFQGDPAQSMCQGEL